MQAKKNVGEAIQEAVKGQENSIDLKPERKSAILKNKIKVEYGKEFANFNNNFSKKNELPNSAYIKNIGINKKVLSVLKKLDEMNNQHSFWNIDWQSGEFLMSIAKLRNAKKILEIGTSTGFSTLWLASGMSEKGKIYTIESSKKRYPIAIDNFKKAGFENQIKLLIGHAPEILNEIKKVKFDLIFIDCGKKYYLELFKILEKQLKVGGVIIADNMISHAVYMEEYFKYVRKNPDFISTLVPIGAGIEVSVKLK